MEELTVVGTSAMTDVMKWSNLDSSVDDALAKHGYSLYTQQMMADDQIKSCIMIKKLGVVVGGHEIHPAVGQGEQGYKEAQKVADFVAWCLSEMDGSIESLLMSIAHALVPGFSVSEILWKEIEQKPYVGMIGIDRIKSRPAENFTFDIDQHGNVRKLVQKVGGAEVDVPLDKVLLYTYDPQQTGKPQGVSDLRAAYAHWWSKRSLMKWRNVAAEKYACPTVLGKYPPGTSEAQKTAFLKALKSFVTDTAIAVPDAMNVELLQVSNSVMAPYTDSIDSCDKSIARSIFGQVLATDEGKSSSGSYAQAKIHQGILGMFLDGLRKEIAEEVLREQLIKRLVDYNFQTEFYPRVVLSKVEERDLTAMAAVMKVLLDGGAIHPDEPFIRSQFGYPPKPLEIVEAEEAAKEAAGLDSESEMPTGEQREGSPAAGPSVGNRTPAKSFWKGTPLDSEDITL